MWLFIKVNGFTINWHKMVSRYWSQVGEVGPKMNGVGAPVPKGIGVGTYTSLPLYIPGCIM
jgi:hypothetical protein